MKPVNPSFYERHKDHEITINGHAHRLVDLNVREILTIEQTNFLTGASKATSQAEYRLWLSCLSNRALGEVVEHVLCDAYPAMQERMKTKQDVYRRYNEVLPSLLAQVTEIASRTTKTKLSNMAVDWVEADIANNENHFVIRFENATHELIEEFNCMDDILASRADIESLCASFTVSCCPRGKVALRYVQTPRNAFLHAQKTAYNALREMSQHNAGEGTLTTATRTACLLQEMLRRYSTTIH